MEGEREKSSDEEESIWEGLEVQSVQDQSDGSGELMKGTNRFPNFFLL